MYWQLWFVPSWWAHPLGTHQPHPPASAPPPPPPVRVRKGGKRARQSKASARNQESQNSKNGHPTRASSTTPAASPVFSLCAVSTATSGTCTHTPFSAGRPADTGAHCGGGHCGPNTTSRASRVAPVSVMQPVGGMYRRCRPPPPPAPLAPQPPPPPPPADVPDVPPGVNILPFLFPAPTPVRAEERATPMPTPEPTPAAAASQATPAADAPLSPPPGLPLASAPPPSAPAASNGPETVNVLHLVLAGHTDEQQEEESAEEMAGGC